MILREEERMVLEARAADALGRRSHTGDTRTLLRELYLKYIPDATVYQGEVAADRILRQQALYRETYEGLETHGKAYIRAQLQELISPLPFAQQCQKLYELLTTVQAAEGWLRQEAQLHGDFRKNLLQDLRQEQEQFSQKLRKAQAGQRFYSGRLTVEARDRLLEQVTDALSGDRLTGRDVDTLLSSPTANAAALEQLFSLDELTAVLSLLIYTMALNGEIENAPKKLSLDQIVLGVITQQAAGQIKADLTSHDLTVHMAEEKLKLLCEAAAVLLACALLAGGGVALILLEVESALLASLIYCGVLVLTAAAYLAVSDGLTGHFLSKNLTVKGVPVVAEEPKQIVTGFREAGIETEPLLISLEEEVFL